ncbi:MAG: hypothetical protein MUE87_02640 [Methanothrix sp.]|nr:hypothetical protein [Methanothrix sp.]
MLHEKNAAGIAAYSQVNCRRPPPQKARPRSRGAPAMGSRSSTLGSSYVCATRTVSEGG